MPELWGLAIHPMLTLKEETPFTDPEWIFEIKWDGTRALCFYHAGKIKLQNRRLYERRIGTPTSESPPMRSARSSTAGS